MAPPMAHSCNAFPHPRTTADGYLDFRQRQFCASPNSPDVTLRYQTVAICN
ncbi:hypothetical protein OCO_16900 [Mycobacterium intracellulare MOTT-02]|uniref:Uncharacterized protein n=1 Tax=Mycobacterium intracellulare (strain ATCC 13950 / DSM 43223 / JCM 6384 / NCTC 13025 / 3600) TaxID=487521 RepID=H8INN7_MYCIA|nr:hypothetical protein OCU_17100 [Mycobacterium intracellulare ATCC 13950]AFC48053.1 hypothetical protein OCO_16900 [Mycobacterium intracellulare MOTT-02]ETZ37495.1 hypothetical protein L843_1923 [Mycobacterium intracellulare MIN_061107_1834]